MMSNKKVFMLLFEPVFFLSSKLFPLTKPETQGCAPQT